VQLWGYLGSGHTLTLARSFVILSGG
jgi:hypothetical protein